MGNKQIEAPMELPAKQDLSGKVAIVTGGNTGLGYELVKGLAEMGAHTIMASRSEERATAAIARMKESSEKDLNVEFMPLDLGSIQSTKDFVRAFKDKNLPLHILINNAAVAMVPFTRTEDGHEIQFQVNHLCPFLLTLELLPVVMETASTSEDTRILFITCCAQESDPVNFDSIDSEALYGRIKGYVQSKLYNVMTALALKRRLPNTSITVSAQNPGPVRTEITRGFSDSKCLTFFAKILYAIAGRSVEYGAATTLNCAVNPDFSSQKVHYYDNCRVVAPNADASNETYQEELWRRSVEALRDHLSPEILDKYGSSSSFDDGKA